MRELAGVDSVRLLELATKQCLRNCCARRGWSYLSSDLEQPDAMVRGQDLPGRVTVERRPGAECHGAGSGRQPDDDLARAS